MSPAHLHLLLNHFPILGTYFGTALLAWGLLRHSDEVSRVALGVFVIAAVMTIPVYLTGQPAEHFIEGAPSVTEQFIAPHEHAAKIALWVSELLGVLALGGLWAFMRRSLLPKWLPSLVFVASLGVGGWMGYTGWLGGQVRHTEVRTDFKGFPHDDKQAAKEANLQSKPKSTDGD